MTKNNLSLGYWEDKETYFSFDLENKKLTAIVNSEWKREPLEYEHTLPTQDKVFSFLDDIIYTYSVDKKQWGEAFIINMGFNVEELKKEVREKAIVVEAEMKTFEKENDQIYTEIPADWYLPIPKRTDFLKPYFCGLKMINKLFMFYHISDDMIATNKKVQKEIEVAIATHQKRIEREIELERKRPYNDRPNLFKIGTSCTGDDIFVDIKSTIKKFIGQTKINKNGYKYTTYSYFNQGVGFEDLT